MFATGSLGDTLLIVPALSLIRDLHPDKQIHFLFDCPTGRSKLTPADVLRGNASIAQFLSYKIPADSSLAKRLFGILALWARLFRRYSMVYYLIEAWEGDARLRRDFAFFKVCGITQIKGFSMVSKRPKVTDISDCRSSEALKRVDKDITDIYRNQLLTPANVRRFLNLHESDQQVNLQNGHFVVSPFSNMSSKNWSIENYKHVCEKICSTTELMPLVMGTRDDRDAIDKLIKIIGRGINISNLETISDIAAYISGAKFYLGNDSGLMHLAAIMDVTCFAIFSERDFRGRWKPLGDRHFLYRSVVPCAGCFAISCPLLGAEYNRCLEEIRWESVADDIDRFLYEKN